MGSNISKKCFTKSKKKIARIYNWKELEHEGYEYLCCIIKAVGIYIFKMNMVSTYELNLIKYFS